ncbi:ABC-F family ATP-binding cassette domain-containing protein [Vibrio sp. 404]|uniref:ABC-F family ATP-binding cassette domain-containing protein n=1 Tax=Vibrio marinisediminis TaxID=2758441 RepID=A0A7W2FMG4_9VIBR|nr:ATP-binding cassette domain-containing protein [Vibrio marinisediminis]MBA5760816.1 ABC-F family ATP-binding cassette domain-containing protein [Vibrio marinisediminis]
MPVLQFSNINHQFDNGDQLFQQLSGSMGESRVGLVGRNGVGKSILISILVGEITPTEGSVVLSSSFAIYKQQPSELLASELSIAQFLGKSAVLEAINQIEDGAYSEALFEIVGEEWDLLSRLGQQLLAMGLPQDPYFPCAKLSGGQLARLQLWQLFESDAQLLVLDEPSNHLDTASKQWLIERIKAFKGAILLVSHDRELLREVNEIWDLSSLGLTVFGGNYDFYTEQKQTERLAVERRMAHINKQQKQLEEQAQRNREKAEQRASHGKRMRKDGSQPKILLDAKKESATARASNSSKNEQLRRAYLQQQEQVLALRQEHLRGQNLYLNSMPSRSIKVVTMFDGVLPFTHLAPLTFQVCANEKIHLAGKNGCGKSTLLKVLQGEVALLQGTIQVNTSLYYLDQHFAVINPQLSMLDNLLQYCEGLAESDARTLLAGIGFRRDSVFRLGEVLSGGEKMKLAMLIVSHQRSQPLLLLDEPDNHLDLESKIVLAQALSAYQGGYILVSHDDDFIVESGPSRQIELEST